MTSTGSVFGAEMAPIKSFTILSANQMPPTITPISKIYTVAIRNPFSLISAYHFFAFLYHSFFCFYFGTFLQGFILQIIITFVANGSLTLPLLISPHLADLGLSSAAHYRSVQSLLFHCTKYNIIHCFRYISYIIRWYWCFFFNML